MGQINLAAGVGVAVREYPTDTGPADYALFVNRHAAGVIEAKRDTEGENLTRVEQQTERYAVANLKWRKDNRPLRFLFDATGQIGVEQRLQLASELEQPTKLALKQSTAQRQNILRAAFSGQLVPQDPNDEPASMLLERIRAERAARDATKSRAGARPRRPNERTAQQL